MAKTGSNEIFERLVFQENLVVKEHDISPTAVVLDKIRTDVSKYVRDVGISKDLDAMIVLEQRFLENDLAEGIFDMAARVASTVAFIIFGIVPLD